MATLRIEYDVARRRARLKISEIGVAWNDIRRACGDWSAEVLEDSPSSASLPWWAFLSARSAISFYVSRHKLNIEFDDASRRFLERSRDNAHIYPTASGAGPVSEADLLEKLSRTGFHRLLTPPQTRNVRKLSAMDAGATFSVPGAGKTTEALSYFFFKRTDTDRLLIVCPKNAFVVWEEQLHECVPSFTGRVVRLVGGEQIIRGLLAEDPSVCLVTYQQLPIVVADVSEFLVAHRCFVFIDESHRMKRGADGVWASTLLSIAHLPEHKLVLSGTPMPQSVLDLVPQFQFLFPEVSVDETTISDLMKPIYVRTTKPELDIPPLQRRAITVPLSTEQKYAYDLLRSEFARQADKALSSRLRTQYRQIGKSAMRLLQFVSNPALLLNSGAMTEELLADVLASGDSPKIAVACARARELAAQGKKTIIWSVFVRNVELISQRLADLGADFIHGGVETGNEGEEETRERKINRFHSDSNAYVLVGNPAACGESISLHTVCHHAIYVDRSFNVAQYLQSEDRIHRLGLAPGQETIVELLISPNTIDETVDMRLRSKVRRMADVLDDPNLNIDPVNFDIEDDELDEEDLSALIEHLKSEPQTS